MRFVPGKPKRAGELWSIVGKYKRLVASGFRGNMHATVFSVNTLEHFGT